MRHIYILKTIFILYLGIIPLYAEDYQIQRVEQVYKKVLERNPILKAQALRIEGLRALIDQANRIPNPNINIESENFSGSQDGFDNTENTVTLSQTIELGGKRKARKDLAKSQADLFDSVTTLKLANLMKEIQITYSKIVLFQSLYELSKEKEAFSKKILSTIKDKIKYGGILAGEQTKAEVNLNIAIVDKQKARNILEQSKGILTSFWNGNVSEIGHLEAINDNKVARISHIQEMGKTLPLQISLKRLDMSRNQLNNEKALAIPNVTFSGGYRRFEGTNDDAFVLGFSIPIPIFNRNGGEITRAKNEKEANEFEYSQKKVSIRIEISNLFKAREVLYQERDLIVNNLLPDSEKALTQIRDAYKLGRVGYLDLIDSQEIYFGVKERFVRNLFELKSNEVSIKAITGEILHLYKGIGKND